jgi:hypothetical protein
MNHDYQWIAIVLGVLLHDLIVVWLAAHEARKSSLDRITATRTLHFSLERRVGRLGCTQAEILRRIESIEGNQR